MNLLAIDTATEVCSAALLYDGMLIDEYQETARDHSTLILSMIDSLMSAAKLKPAQLDGLAFGRGPGSFTGLRIAAGVAQGIAFAADCPVVPVSDLAAIAQRTWRERGQKNVLAAIDARMSEVYWGAFELQENWMQPVLEECVSPPGEVPVDDTLTGRSWAGAGTGWGSYPDVLLARYSAIEIISHESCLPHAVDILELSRHQFEAGMAVAPELAQPVYLRDKVAKTLAERGVSKRT